MPGLSLRESFAVTSSKAADQSERTPDESAGTADDKDVCPLSEDLQRRNSLVYIINWSTMYFIAPVSYVGVLHADILKAYEFNDKMANLPAAVNAWVLPLPVIVAWSFTSTRFLRPLLIGSYLVMGTLGLIIAALFFTPSKDFLLWGLVTHAAFNGIVGGVLTMCMWEVLRQGMSPRRRGRTLSLAFGIGPMFAVLGSLLSDLILSGNFLGEKVFDPMSSPWNYMTIFGVTGPLLLMLIVTSLGVTVPPREAHLERLSFKQNLQGMTGYLSNHLILLTLAAFLLTYAGCSYIMPNLGLYITDVTGEPADNYTGAKMALRFGCKCAYGFLLGMLMVRFHAKVPLLLTTGTCLVGMIWALFIPGKLYLLAFGFLGAGELFYLYFMNYIVSCAPRENVRQYSAYTGLFPAVLGFVAVLYGNVSDEYGYRASFWLALAFLVSAMVIVILSLPNQPPRARAVDQK
ncbi:MAG: MFS transporter [Planctomycetota bacterium]|nr:MFS transporter [Planctomycetota bacterium]